MFPVKTLTNPGYSTKGSILSVRTMLILDDTMISISPTSSGS